MTRRTVLSFGAGALGAGALGAGALGAAGVGSPSKSSADDRLVAAVRNHAIPMTGSDSDLQPVIRAAQNASFVLIGEASHGTHEFYATRAAITRRLIEELGFNAVLVEADWPDAYRVNRFVRNESDEPTAEQALSVFDKFPQWMWGNADVRDFVNWLRERNGSAAVRTGFYGMDLYSLFRSRDAVVQYLDQIDAGEAERAREQYAKLQGGSGDTDPQLYGQSVAYGVIRSAAKAVRKQYEHVQRLLEPYRNSGDPAVADAAFNAEQNARLIVNSEEYYRQMYDPRVNTWNLRDRHMVDTLDALAEHLRRRDGYARIAVWAHNSHLGDARATDSRLRGEWNVGQLVRERHPDQALLVGFSTNTGTVMATSDWGQPGVVKQVRPALAGSYERAFHESGIASFVLPLQGREEFEARRLQRAIGVIYRPDTERQSHYFEAKLAKQFDVMIHFDETRAVQPLGAAEPVVEERAA